MFIRHCKLTNKYLVLEHLSELETTFKWTEFNSLIEAKQYITIQHLNELQKELQKNIKRNNKTVKY